MVFKIKTVVLLGRRMYVSLLWTGLALLRPLQQVLLVTEWFGPCREDVHLSTHALLFCYFRSPLGGFL